VKMRINPNNVVVNNPLSVDGNINVGGLTASRIVETDATKTLVSVVKNTAYNKNFGTASGTVCQGNDSRLSDARTILSSGSDWNTITDNRANTSSTNGPVSSSVFIGLNIVHNSGSGYRFQIMGRNNGFYVRTMENSTWKDYQKLWTEANDGTGSGLDADLLDGQHGSWYQQAIAGTANRILKIQSDGTGYSESIISDDGTTAKCEGRLHVQGTPTFIGDTTRLLSITDLSAVAQGVGGGIDFQGKYNTSGDNTTFCGIKGVKANSTAGNYSGELHFQTRKHGSSPVTHWIIDEDGNIKGDGNIIGSGNHVRLCTDTVDGADNKWALLTSTPTYLASRGAYIALYGNQHTNTGNIKIIAGNGNGTTTGAVEVSPRMYFGTRPSTDDFLIALSDRHTINVIGSGMTIANNSYNDNGEWKYRFNDQSVLVSFGGDGDLAIKTANNGNIGTVVPYNNTLYLNKSGNVAIGHTSPSEKLDILGNVKLSGYISSTTGGIIGKSVTDLNDTGANTAKLFTLLSSTYNPANKPSGASYWTGFEFRHNIAEDYRSQLLTSTSNPLPILAIRNKINGVWGSHYTVYHTGNFDPSTKADSNHNHDSRYARLNLGTATTIEQNRDVLATG
ncbi:MAG: hypothetical protein GX638_18905, partial [Crenarchaeota archaeon]|nr:hypothetical protein [Thermoproteota archaeon]